MNLISQIFLIILIACFTGTVSLGFWRVFQPLLLKRDPRLVYATLRFVCMMYIVPFGYLIVRLTWCGYLRTESIWKPNFEMAGDMDLVFGDKIAVFHSALSESEKYAPYPSEDRNLL